MTKLEKTNYIAINNTQPNPTHFNKKQKRQNPHKQMLRQFKR